MLDPCKRKRCGSSQAMTAPAFYVALGVIWHTKASQVWYLYAQITNLMENHENLVR